MVIFSEAKVLEQTRRHTRSRRFVIEGPNTKDINKNFILLYVRF